MRECQGVEAPGPSTLREKTTTRADTNHQNMTGGGESNEDGEAGTQRRWSY